jgi:hypothetical protein
MTSSSDCGLDSDDDDDDGSYLTFPHTLLALSLVTMMTFKRRRTKKLLNCFGD